MSREERTHEYYERVLLHTECKTAKGKPIKPIEYFDKIDAIAIPDGATNGDMIKAMFPNAEIDANPYSPSVDIFVDGILMMRVDRNWWNAPYKKGETK